MSKTKIKILVTGGGTGGHIYPIIAVASELKKLSIKQGRQIEIKYIGNSGKYRKALEESGIEVSNILGSKLRRYFSIQNLIDVPKFAISIFQALWKIYFFHPDAVFSKGGSGAVAVVIAAKIHNIPIVIHESDSIPSLTSSITARYANVVATAFASTIDRFNNIENKGVVTGNPIRDGLLEEKFDQGDAKNILGLEESLPVVLIIGGSQGSLRINNAILEILPDLLRISQIIHQTGDKNYDDIIRKSNELKSETHNGPIKRYKVFPYFRNNINTALSAADIIVSRAGAGAIFEIAAFAKPSILIPLPGAANNHQLQNAVEYSKTGATIIIEEKELSNGILVETISRLIKDKPKLMNMSNAAKSFYFQDSALNLAEITLNIIR